MKKKIPKKDNEHENLDIDIGLILKEANKAMKGTNVNQHVIDKKKWIDIGVGGLLIYLSIKTLNAGLVLLSYLLKLPEEEFTNKIMFTGFLALYAISYIFKYTLDLGGKYIEKGIEKE